MGKAPGLLLWHLGLESLGSHQETACERWPAPGAWEGGLLTTHTVRGGAGLPCSSHRPVAWPGSVRGRKQALRGGGPLWAAQVAGMDTYWGSPGELDPLSPRLPPPPVSMQSQVQGYPLPRSPLLPLPASRPLSPGLPIPAPCWMAPDPSGGRGHLTGQHWMYLISNTAW